MAFTPPEEFVGMTDAQRLQRVQMAQRASNYYLPTMPRDVIDPSRWVRLTARAKYALMVDEAKEALNRKHLAEAVAKGEVRL